MTHFWTQIRADYDLPTDFTQLENGYYNVLPRPTLNAYRRHQDDLNRLGSFYLRRRWTEDLARITSVVAEAVGAAVEQIVLTRNTTESIGTVLNGFPWRRGDHVILSCVDYGAMRELFQKQARVHGIEVTELQLPNGDKTTADIVVHYERAITPRTRMIHLPHLVHLTGEILPVREICALGNRRGIPVFVDGAHAVGQLDFRIDALGATFYATSLHKWLAAPLGTGLLYVAPDWAARILPPYPDASLPTDTAARFGHYGTFDVAAFLTLPDAVAYYRRMGGARKEARLRALTGRWLEAVKNLPKVVVNTPLQPERYGALANVGLNHLTPTELHRRLLDDYGLWTVAIDEACVRGVRATVNVFNTLEEVDRLAAALREIGM